MKFEDNESYVFCHPERYGWGWEHINLGLGNDWTDDWEKMWHTQNDDVFHEAHIVLSARDIEVVPCLMCVATRQ